MSGKRIKMIAKVIRAFPELGKVTEKRLQNWLTAECGVALERWVVLEGGRKVRAVAPQMIYHVCAGNLALSGWQSVIRGLILGSFNVVKVSSRQKKEMQRFIEKLPRELREKVVLEEQFSKKRLVEADAVIVFGRDETVEEIKKEVRRDQIFMGYGHQASFIWVGKNEGWSEELLKAVSKDVMMFSQEGCLSAQGVYLEKGRGVGDFCEALSEVMQKEKKGLPRPDQELAARIQEARDVAWACGNKVYGEKRDLRWSVIWDREKEFELSCGGCVVYVREIKASELPSVLAPFRGSLSTVGVWDGKNKDLFREAGVKRICKIGEMQSPPWEWHQDGMETLRGLVRWVDCDILG